jgi:dienelactone hydrolase
MNIIRMLAILLIAVSGLTSLLAQAPPAKPKLKDELRMPWKRGNDDFLRLWLVTGPIPGRLTDDQFGSSGGEALLKPADGQEYTLVDGAKGKWHFHKAWGDDIGIDAPAGNVEQAVSFAFTRILRASAGKVLLSFGSANGIRVWVNGSLVIIRDGLRSTTPDEDQVEVEMLAGENALLVKTGAPGQFFSRVLEHGSVLPRKAEIGPSLVKLTSDGFTVKTDVRAGSSTADLVKVVVIRSGGAVLFDTVASRGSELAIDAHQWGSGPYEIRCTTRKPSGLLYATHLPWYKGDFHAKALELENAAAAADASKPEGFTLKMLAAMVEDRLGGRITAVQGNPWQKVHSPLMEYEEMMLERKGLTGRIRPYGFVRLAYRDEVDGSPQFCRAYLPGDYDPARKWPVVIQIHGYNPANPVYVRWWAADERHSHIDGEFSNHQGVIYLEPHGRGNTRYLGLGDTDILNVIAEAKKLFNVDEDRIYLTGDSMGGWGTWHISTRHPDLFAAIAPVFGGVDYHAQMSEEQLARLSPLERFLNEKQSSWALADGLLNTPIFVHHGDEDQAVNVDYSRWGVRLLQRWGYDVRYHEYPGRVHEALESQNGNLNIEWFLQHKRDANPKHIRIRSAELRNASAYWAKVIQCASPLAFMALDAEVVEANVIRLDTDNILDIELTPSTVLVDHKKPVRVVWNGVPRQMIVQNGKLHLSAPGYAPSALQKTPGLPGSLGDFTVTPFAVVIGTVSKDPRMAELCRSRASDFVSFWQEWQKVKPRVFEDTAISAEDMAKYSLMLVGGPEANSLTARLMEKVPLKISADRIAVDGKEFPVKDAAVQMLYPNPFNNERYILIVAGTSIDGMYFSEVSPAKAYDWGYQGLYDFDFIIRDGVIPARKQQASQLQTRVVSGMFDRNWHYNDSLIQLGDPSIRVKGRLRHRPDENLQIGAKLLDSYVGRYQIAGGPLLEVYKTGSRLWVKGQGMGNEMMLPASDTSFEIPKYDILIEFVRDRSGKVTDLFGYRDEEYEAKRVR